MHVLCIISTDYNKYGIPPLIVSTTTTTLAVFAELVETHSEHYAFSVGNVKI